MAKTQQVKDELLSKANSLPPSPGVYIMRDRNGKVIYVGKSRALKNRVSQYFQNSQKNVKTAKMVSAVESFDYILCQTEIEALPELRLRGPLHFFGRRKFPIIHKGESRNGKF